MIFVAGKKFTYQAIEVRETPVSAPFYVASVGAEQLLQWCSVPRKREEFMVGYQRDLDKRHEKIKAFFEEDPKNNIIPNSIIVAVKDNHCNISKRDNGFCDIEVVFDDTSFDAMLKNAYSSLLNRLNDDEKNSVNLDDVDDADADDDSDEASPPQSYLSILTKMLKGVIDDPESVSSEFYEIVKSYVVDTNKPGLIIDGQHRVFGAKEVNDFEVNLPVIIMPNLSSQEQVFHFYVLNNKAKPLSPTELRTIVSTSLSKGEIDDLYSRFKQVGVTAEQTEWTHRMNCEKGSPFRDVLNMGLPGSKGVIKENIAYQVVSKFVKMPRKYKLLYGDIEEWDGLDKYHYRLQRFFTFWKAIKDLYPNAWQAGLSGENKQILQKVSLINLQAFVLYNLTQQMPKRIRKNEPSPLENLDDLYEEVQDALSFLKEDFFLMEWKLKGLDTTPGHEIFFEQIQKAINNQSLNLGNMKLFKQQA